MELSVMLGKLAEGMLTTAAIFFLTLLGSLPLGMLVAFGRMSKNRLVAFVMRIYISLMRGTPLMLQLLVVYFGPFFIFKLQVGQNYRFTAVIIAFVLNYAAYFAEIYRAGIASMPVGQYEAAQVLGYSRTQTFVRIILPQVVKRILPAMTNEIITLVKDTSLAYAIGVAEMFTNAKAIASADKTMVPLAAAGIFYYVYNLVVAYALERCEKRLDYYR